MTKKSDHDLLIEIHAMCCERCCKVEKHEATLYGNGKRGLVAKVHLLMWLLGIASSIGVIALGEWGASLLRGG